MKAFGKWFAKMINIRILEKGIAFLKFKKVQIAKTE